jgi:YesN/AraC family two-component response regulator
MRKEIMPASKSILVVDDEESVRTMLRMVLEGEGYAVTTAGTVPQALALIAQSSFDVLISDLNIGHPSDGFVVVSAMRRTHPAAQTFILTGYPAFQAALEAVRQHVNQYLIKGTSVEQLVEKIRAGIDADAASQPPQPSKRVAVVIEQSKEEVIAEWLRRVEAHKELSSVEMSLQDRKDHVPSLLDEAVAHARDEVIGEKRQQAARQHGELRYRQGYSVTMLIAEARLLQNVIADCVRQNFLVIDLSNLISDMARISDTVTLELERSVRAFAEQQLGRPVR